MCAEVPPLCFDVSSSHTPSLQTVSEGSALTVLIRSEMKIGFLIKFRSFSSSLAQRNSDHFLFPLLGQSDATASE